MPLLQLITWLAGAFSLVMVIITIKKMREEARFSRMAPLLGIAATTLITFAYIALSGVRLNWTMGSILVVLGLLVGYLQGASSRLYYSGTALMTKRSITSMAIWGAAYLFSIALTQTENPVLAAGGLLTLLFGLGATVGTHLNLLRRSTRVQPVPIGAPLISNPIRGTRPTDSPESRSRPTKPTELPK